MSDVVKVSKDELLKRFTCPLCGKLLEEATAINECLDIFCRKCIYQNLEDGEGDCCPKCKAGLGSNPLERLRSDEATQRIMNMIFPLQSDNSKGRKTGSSRAQGNSARRVVKSKNTQHGNGTGQVRFTLLASKDKNGNSLPQISSGSLILQDGHLPVPYFQKYLKKKLNLKSETEVEITIDDQLLSPGLPVSSLIDQWQQKRSLSAQKSEGSASGKVDITLHYRPSHSQE